MTPSQNAPRGPTLVTGGAGFIGSQVVSAILEGGGDVVVLDNFDPFYDVAIKRRRVANLEGIAAKAGRSVRIDEGDIRVQDDVDRALGLGTDTPCRDVVHLAALAGVRPSIEDPVSYFDVNVTGTALLLERAERVGEGTRFVFGSSSSVYGGNRKVPFAEDDPVDHPISPYAASKRAAELAAYAFHALTGRAVTCLRFFTVYGPGQRPEMAIHAFTRAIEAGAPLPFFGDGSSRRDYTYVADIVDGVLAALERADGFSIYNLGGARTTTLEELVKTLERVMDRTAVLDRRPAQPGDVPATRADISSAQRELNYAPKVDLDEGLTRLSVGIERNLPRGDCHEQTIFGYGWCGIHRIAPGSSSAGQRPEGHGARQLQHGASQEP